MDNSEKYQGMITENNKGALIGYARVSTKDQNLEIQTKALEKAGCTKIFKEKISGAKSSSDRPELNACFKYLREGDTLVIYKLDRLGRSLQDLVATCSHLERRGITIMSIKDGFQGGGATGKLMMNMFAILAEFERDIIRERCAEGLKNAKEKGVKLGRPKSEKVGKMATICANMYKAELSVAYIQKTLGLKSKTTVYNYLAIAGITPDRKKANEDSEDLDAYNPN